ncbi:MAG: DUF4145 domain-containing protein [bacterium]
MNEKIPFSPPMFEKTGFNCPFCNAFSKQEWGCPSKVAGNTNYGRDENFQLCRCSHCGQFSIWISTKMIYPNIKTTPLPNLDLPKDIKADYEEARNIANDSPRGAAALLRLAIQKLCKHLGGKGKNINDDIAKLVKEGLPIKIQQALDVVRVVGNNAVHPGQIDVKDNSQGVNSLFGLINFITEVMITQPKHIAQLYENVIPFSQQDAIKKRDS